MDFAYKSMIKISGILIFLTGIFMLPCMIYAFILKDTNCFFPFTVSGGFSVCLGGLLFCLTKKAPSYLNIRNAHLIVFLGWLICSIIGTFPYYLSYSSIHFIDAFFESVAGYTTTGISSICESAMPKSLLLWKALSHWIGATGILVFIVTILPIVGSGRRQISITESPEINLSHNIPKPKRLAAYIYIIYSIMTIAETFLLSIGSDMNIFESVITSLGSVSTAAIMIHPDGLSYYNSDFVNTTVSVFTILASLNFLVFIFIAKNGLREFIKNVETRVFLGLIFIGSILVSINLFASDICSSFGEALKIGSAQTISFMTTSGFAFTDYVTWPTFSKMLMFIMLFIGGCLASTSGSIKVMRIIIMLKLIKRDFFKKLHPRSIQNIKVSTYNVSARTVSSITSFVFLYMGTFLFGVVIISTSGLDLETVISTTASLLSTTGAAFGKVGWTGDYSIFSPGIKIFMSLLMLIGRLELFSAIMVFFPSFWNPNKANTLA